MKNAPQGGRRKKMGSISGQMGGIACQQITESPGFAARDRLFREIEELSISIGKLENKLAPISCNMPDEATNSMCGGASSEYFAAIFDAASRVREIKRLVDCMLDSVEL